MQLTILGSGTSVPHPQRSSSAYWLAAKSGSLLLDCSASAQHRMAQEQLDWANLDAIWISHFHLDHCGGVAPFLFGTKYARETQGRVKPLRIFGPPGIKRLVAAFDAANDYGLMRQPFSISVIEIEALAPFEIIPDIEAIAAKTPHTSESHAIHLREKTSGATLVYTADTGFSEPLATLARNADLFVIECSFVREKPVEIHLELAEAMHLIRRAAPRRAVLTHLYAEWDIIDFDAEVKKFQPGCEVLMAADGLRLDVSQTKA